MEIEGWAFTGPETETRMSKLYGERYKEIAHLLKGMEMRTVSAHNHVNFSGKLPTDEHKTLTATDIAILADGGNLSFGGQCTVHSDHTFSGRYNTE